MTTAIRSLRDGKDDTIGGLGTLAASSELPLA
ncbi:hypothetical protein ABIF29_005556 [Bradyrhizobium elkanii]|uniref:Uncharacterized protein n=1 Tax=Bradyrhizobium elkanii TaxID=29448 RepID=A0ABV4F5M8_BRAEL|nr:hypothetical protein [Bradyrhizobium elkanii]MCP1976101.1 hypothetical protein [Bradyrhizobium elkanii]MCS3693294.1 hypothetical protein [Bradyrhizobium elkanii]MCS3889382.1 hypothetical protein [Bradyrhizobium elkanii]MCS4211597.1 hypothetical protein [Bradyrhizobium elkanii]